MLLTRRVGFGGVLAWGLVPRMGLIVALLVVHRLCFFWLYRHIGGAAFLPSMIPCLISGALFGTPGGLATVAVSSLLDRSLALAVHIDSGAGVPSLIMSVLTKLILALGAAFIMQASRRRQQSEAALAASERRYRALVESLGEGVGLFDETDRCVFANPAWYKTFGKSESEIMQVAFSEHLDPASQQRVAEHRDVSTVAQRSYEVVLKGREQAVLLVTETRLASDESNGAHRTLRVVRDLTDRIESDKKQRELERQLQRGQALQSLAVLAGGVAHDFNNLLSGIIGNVEFALRRVPRSAPLELTQCLDEIGEFAGEAAQLSRQMLAYAGRRSLALSTVNLNTEVREALRLLHSTIETHAVLRLELADDLPMVKADRLQLRQIVTNLVLNALDAMNQSRGILTISTRAQQLGEADLVRMQAPEGLAAGTYATLSVQDSGTGIPAELKERIFDPFFSTKSPGRGMGLSASLGIVRSHRGWIDYESELNKGTTFRVLLPSAHESQPPVRRLTPTDLKVSRAASILLIDDEAAVRIVTNRLLLDLGQRVMTADSGRRGLELYRQHHASIDLVLLDLTMPELSGPEVLDELRRIRHDVSVVVTSGFHPSNVSEVLQSPNVVGFLEKPHTLANLEAIVASIFSN